MASRHLSLETITKYCKAGIRKTAGQSLSKIMPAAEADFKAVDKQRAISPPRKSSRLNAADTHAALQGEGDSKRAKTGRHVFCNPPTDEEKSTNFDNPPYTGWRRIAHHGKDSANHFISNNVKTARYTVWDFLPKQIVFQFSKLANMYFLLVGCLQLVPNWSPTGRLTTIGPLAFFVTLAILREAWEDNKRHKCDEVENRAECKRLSRVSHKWEKIQWRDVKVGDIVLIESDQIIPADVVLLQSSNENGVCYVETTNLDGETNLKLRQALKDSVDRIKDLDSLANYRALILTGSPDDNVHEFEGFLVREDDDKCNKLHLGISNILLRGSNLRNTAHVYAAVIYTGEETKIRMNAAKSIRTKNATLEGLTNRIVVIVFLFVLALATISTVSSTYLSVTKSGGAESGHWYLGQTNIPTVEIFFSFVVLYNALIPIALYVTMEIVRIVQAFFIVQDVAMFDEETDTRASAKTLSLNEDLGQVKYLFSDKTGTLTENVMEFRKASVTGASYVYGAATAGDEQPLDALVKELQLNNSPAAKTQQMFAFAMAVCHTVIPEKKTVVSGTKKIAVIEYQAASSDEVALVKAAKNMKFELVSRSMNTLALQHPISNKKEEVQILHVLEFTSHRKRMSIIIKNYDGRILLLCKGADSIVQKLLVPADKLSAEAKRVSQKTDAHLAGYANEGLRTLLYAFKELSESEYNEWNQKYKEAMESAFSKQVLIEAAQNAVEANLTLLGATAIEDKLQRDVPETIDKLRAAGIRVWMLTGDKRETAINIGHTCHLIRPESDVIRIEGATISEITHSVEQAHSKCVANQDKKRADGSRQHTVAVIDGDTYTQLEAQWEATRMGRQSDNQADSLVSVSAIGGLRQRMRDLFAKKSAEAGEATLLHKFFEVGMLVDSVICARFSPSQKALTVSCMKALLSKSKKTYWGPHQSCVTLAIGDGANDIPMLQCAHVGVGITGREGLAASRASDYSIAKFRFLQRLLLVHGHYSYIRISKFILGTFYKCVALYTTQALYGSFHRFSGTSFYESWTLVMYNVIFTSLPVIIVGAFDKDLQPETLVEYPQLYSVGQNNQVLNYKSLIQWALIGIAQSFIAIFLPMVMYEGYFSKSNPSAGLSVFNLTAAPAQETYLFTLGTLSYTIIVFLVTIRICYFKSENWNAVIHGFALFSLSVWFIWQAAYSVIWPKLGEIGYESLGLLGALRGVGGWWFTALLGIVVGWVLEFALFGFAVCWQKASPIETLRAKERAAGAL